MRFQPVRQRHKAYTLRNAVGKTRETYMAPNPSFKALQFLSHMDLKKRSKEEFIFKSCS